MKINRTYAAKTILMPVVLASIILVISGLLRPLYEDIDNYTISLVTNSLYDKDNYCEHLHPLLCNIIKGITAIFPMADAYLLLAHFLVWLETVWLLYLAITADRGKIQRIAYFGLIIFGSVAINLFNANFTIQAASFFFTGCLTHFLYYNNPKKSLIHFIITFVFITFGIMWRLQAALIFIPFIMLEVAALLYENRKAKIVKNSFYGQSFLIIIMCIVLIVSQNMTKASDKYKDAIKYDEARAELEDFPVLAWNDIENELQGIDELDYEAVINWFLADTERLNSNTLSRMAVAASTTRYPFNLLGFCIACTIIIKFAFYQTKILWLVLLLVVMCLTYILVSKLAVYRKIESVLVILGGITILVYFTILGRAFLRIWYAVIYAILFGIIIQLSKVPVEKDNSKVNLFFFTAIASISIISVVLLCIHQGVAKPNTALLARAEIYDERHTKTCINDNFYLWGDWMEDVSGYYMKTGKLPSEEFINHNADDGSWVYNQVYFNNNLADAGISNPIKALLERDNTYYISKDYQFMLQYMRRFYGEDIEASQVDELDGIPIWQFYHGGEAK